MSKIAALALFGLGLMGTGMFWMVFDRGLISELIAKYWVDTAYLQLMYRGWNVLPIIVLFIGILAVIFAGIGSKSGRLTAE